MGSVLQCVAACCLSHGVALCDSVFRCVAVCYNVFGVLPTQQMCGIHTLSSPLSPELMREEEARGVMRGEEVRGVDTQSSQLFPSPRAVCVWREKEMKRRASDRECVCVSVCV